MGFSYNSKISGGIGTAGSAIAPGGLTSGRVALSYDADSVTDSADLTFNDTTNTLTTEAVSVRNVTATALATPVITPPVSPVLSLLTTVTVVAGASLVDGDYFTLSDGSAVVYEFDNDATVTPGRVGITFVGDETAQEIRDLVIIAINGSTLEATAIAAAADTLTVTSDTAGDSMGVNSENVANAGFLVPAWSEPTHTTTYGYQVEACLADGTCAPSAEVQTTTGHATLSNANYNSVTWGAVSGAATYKLYRVTGTPSGGDAPPRLLYTGPLLNFSDTNATSTSEAVATGNETGVVTGRRVALGGSYVYSPWGGQTNFTDSGGISPGDIGFRYVFGGDGSAANVPYGFTNEAGLGMYHSALKTLGFAAGSVVRTTISDATMDSSVPIGVGAALGAQTAQLTKMGVFGFNTKNIADASATPFETFTIADGETYGGKVIYSVVAVKGTALQQLDGELRFSATREGSTYTAVAGTTHEALGQTLAAAAGTLTGGVTIACAAGVCTLYATFDTSQSSPDSFVINYRNDVPGDDRMTAL